MTCCMLNPVVKQELAQTTYPNFLLFVHAVFFFVFEHIGELVDKSILLGRTLVKI